VKVVIATAHDAAYKSLAAITRPSWENLCSKHDYGFYYDPHIPEAEKDACKARIFADIYVTGEYGPNDVYCWADTDALCMNSNRRIESIVYEHMPKSVHYLIGTDPNGLNSGFFIARFSAEAALFIRVAYATSVISGWADQEGLIQTALKEPHRSIYKEIPGKVFNCNLYPVKGWDLGEYGKYINEYEDGDFCLHLAGVEPVTRDRLLREYAAKAV
jgi:hypothetical protein